MKSQLILLITFTIVANTFAQNPLTFTYKTIDDLNITLDVYVPTVSPYSKYPVLFGIHGGAYVEGAKSSGYRGYSPLELSEILSLGFVAVTIDYRLAPGVLLGDIVEDVQDAYKFVRTVLVNIVSINVDAIIVWGRSAGGGLSVISGYMLDPRPNAVISFYPYCTNFTDPYAYNPSTPLTAVVIAEAALLRKPIITEFTNYGPTDPRNILFQTSLSQGKAGWVLSTTNATETPENILAYLRNYSAVWNVDSNYPPTYLIHGLSDTLVPFDQSVQLASVFDANNITHVMDLIPGVGHGFDDGVTDPNSSIWHQHFLPIFDFAVSIISKAYEKSDMIIN